MRSNDVARTAPEPGTGGLEPHGSDGGDHLEWRDHRSAADVGGVGKRSESAGSHERDQRGDARKSDHRALPVMSSLRQVVRIPDGDWMVRMGRRWGEVQPFATAMN